MDGLYCNFLFFPADPVLYPTDPDPDPTFNNGFIKLFSSQKNIDQNQPIPPKNYGY